jgi:hypothetical protein
VWPLRDGGPHSADACGDQPDPLGDVTLERIMTSDSRSSLAGPTSRQRPSVEDVEPYLVGLGALLNRHFAGAAVAASFEPRSSGLGAFLSALTFDGDAR